MDSQLKSDRRKVEAVESERDELSSKQAVWIRNSDEDMADARAFEGTLREELNTWSGIQLHQFLDPTRPAPDRITSGLDQLVAMRKARAMDIID